jgi:hypothetical protein
MIPLALFVDFREKTERFDIDTVSERINRAHGT